MLVLNQLCSDRINVLPGNFADKFVFDRSQLTDELLEKRLEAAMRFLDNPPMRIGPGDSMEPLWRHPNLMGFNKPMLLIYV